MTNPESLPYRPCVGIMLLNAENKVFIGRRADAPDDPEGPGQWWQMPQGGIDEGEDTWLAALRELHEETSVRSVEKLAETDGWLTYDFPPGVVGQRWKNVFRGQKQKWYAVRLTGPESEIDVLTPGGGAHKAEFSVWRWEDMDRVPELIIPFKREVYLQVIDRFRHLVQG
ncbi:RNA pyrophosphohydrolase [Agaricicola taiwanensis]|uniref:RNA pyrophosphohydrolase n=1 Tax=Agaricicola taiwanensis TaxID=591372 RepID=A0A8J2VDZ5_9RHOB|nr:RNA pyrophosphohydrolase [Agaricicola taiwanensis]GGE26977.1 RNA pyrophosphohydrolase [Agaricicola taiwanensis]